MKTKGNVALNSLCIMVFLSAFTDQRISRYSELGLQRSSKSSFKHVHDAMMMAKENKVRTRKALPVKSLRAVAVKERIKKKQSPIVSSSDYSIPVPTAMHSREIVIHLVNPKPKFSENFDSTEKTYLHDFSSPISSLVSEELSDGDKLVLEKPSLFRQLPDEADILWSKKPHTHRRVIGFVSSCAGKVLPSSHLTNNVVFKASKPIYDVIEKLYASFENTDSEEDRRVAENLIGILEIYASYEGAKLDSLLSGESGFKDINADKLCSQESEESERKAQKRLICIIESQKKETSSKFSSSDLHVLNFIQQLLSYSLTETGEKFLAETDSIFQALSDAASIDPDSAFLS